MCPTATGRHKVKGIETNRWEAATLNESPVLMVAKDDSINIAGESVVPEIKMLQEPNLYAQDVIHCLCCERSSWAAMPVNCHGVLNVSFVM